MMPRGKLTGRLWVIIWVLSVALIAGALVFELGATARWLLSAAPPAFLIGGT